MAGKKNVFQTSLSILNRLPFMTKSDSLLHNLLYNLIVSSKIVSPSIGIGMFRDFS
jgi:hypothetical protein